MRSSRCRPAVLHLAAVLCFISVVHGQSILVLDNNSTYQRLQNAVTNLGLPYTRAIAGDFTTLMASQSWDLVLVDLPSTQPMGAWQQAIIDHIAAGGRVIHSHWSAGTLTAGLQSALEFTQAGTHATLTFYRWNGSALFTTPNSVDDIFDDWVDVWGSNGFFLEPTGTAVAAAGFTPTPTVNQAAIVIGNGGRTIMNGFLYDDFANADQDLDGRPDIVELLENEISLLIGPSCAITAPASMATVSGEVDVTFNGAHPQMQALSAVFEWSTDTGTTWNPATAAATSPTTNPAAGLATPFTGRIFRWDSSADGVATAMVTATLVRIRVSDGTASSECRVAVDVDNVPPAPTCTLAAPALARGDAVLDFVGDSVNAPTLGVLLEWSTDAGATFAPCTMSAASPRPNPASGVPIGPASWTWATRADGIGLGGLVTGVVVRATLDDGVSPLTGLCSDTLDIDNTMICFGICGDCNLNAAGPDILDALLAAQVAAALVTPTMVQIACCDVDATGIVSILDALRIAQAAAALPVTLVCL